MNIINSTFYAMLSVVWNDTDVKKFVKIQMLKDWKLIALCYDDDIVHDELEFLIKILQYKD